MENLDELLKLRTKEELVNYFEQRDQSITEEEIKALKKSYEQAEEANGNLTLQQLDEVAGGVAYDLVMVHRNVTDERLNEILIANLPDYGDRIPHSISRLQLINDQNGETG